MLLRPTRGRTAGTFPAALSTTRLCLLAAACTTTVGAPEVALALDLPPVPVSYRIEAELHPDTRGLEGKEEIRWRNETGESIAALPMHLYLNGFAHQETTWMRESAPRRPGESELLARNPDPWGYMEPVTITQRVGNEEREVSWRPIQPDDGNPFDRSLGEITLAQPAAPGEVVVLNVTFTGRLPEPMARTGGGRGYFLVGQWYPKIGVIEPAGVRHAPAARRAARQFHGPTEFYADFADYDVTFATPPGWMVGATGRLAPPAAGMAPRTDGLVTARYTQRAVIDFALVASQHLVDRWERHSPAGGGPTVDIRYMVPAGTEHQIPRWHQSIAGALDVLGSRVGPYPYDVLTVVMPPFWAGATGGMEYPTFITGGSGDRLVDNPLLSQVRLGEVVNIHEFGHQYFHGLLASNEQEEAFLDEGFNSYWEGEITRALYGDAASLGYVLGRRVEGAELGALRLGSAAETIHEPMRKRPTWLFEDGTWSLQAYPRSAVTFATAAALFGQERVDRVFAEYFRRFVFKHPDTEDFLKVAAEVGGAEFEAFCREAFGKDHLPDYAVTDADVTRFKVPLGRIITAEGPLVVTRENRAQHAGVGLPEEAREEDGQVLVEILDPGWVSGSEERTGTIQRVKMKPEQLAPFPDHRGHRADDGHFTSEVTITGPGWATLPVEVLLRFADGAVVHDTWDGRARWRRYRVLRGAPLVDARVDPAHKIQVDAAPQNNALAVDADEGFARDWGFWLGAVAEWIAGGASLWL
ncbi:M1 family metallopeptidase [Chondromyces apiculatus]|uniref:Peptidase M1 membrane alanine aminopeptidase domain-containing protein n=1 Tax=Chondromyces apiculatus DSM 436 TaxID=1192034 RepID=A0A017SYW7_9BACT|nr:M1 family metallopeptidase [Chondromyces apiculatus]EYF02174.1 Hypothetical protein CAP_7385 [Chondromyces apiculatus DSM 436]